MLTYVHICSCPQLSHQQLSSHVQCSACEITELFTSEITCTHTHTHTHTQGCKHYIYMCTAVYFRLPDYNWIRSILKPTHWAPYSFCWHCYRGTFIRLIILRIRMVMIGLPHCGSCTLFRWHTDAASALCPLICINIDCLLPFYTGVPNYAWFFSVMQNKKQTPDGLFCISWCILSQQQEVQNKWYYKKENVVRKKETSHNS